MLCTEISSFRKFSVFLEKKTFLGRQELKEFIAVKAIKQEIRESFTLKLKNSQVLQHGVTKL